MPVRPFAARVPRLPRVLRLVGVLACASVAWPAVQSGQQSAPGQQSRPPVGIPDCNDNGIPDAHDLASGRSEDCNGNLVPDECDLGARLLLAESFEAGEPQGWLLTGLWHVTSSCPRPSDCSGENYAYFGSDGDCTFTIGGSGDMVLPPIDLPADADSIVLTYCSAYEGEGEDPYDAADVRVNGNLLDHASPEPQLDWETRTVDLTPYIGQSVSIRFEFDTMDHFLNKFLGWQVDNIRILAFGSGAASVDCNANGLLDECELDCNANGVPDDCDLADATSPDCQLNGILDECELASGAALDCNLNGVPDVCDLSTDLVAGVGNLDVANTTITGFFPDTFEFTDGTSGSCIPDGGMNMYDCGNTLNTNLTTQIPYTDGQVVATGAFGVQSKHVTAKYPGLFVLAAVDCGISSFEIGGFNGTDGVNAQVDDLELSVTVDGAPWRVYVKRVYDTLEPSVNQLMIVPGDGTGLTHNYAFVTPAQCYQELSGLGGVDRIYYVVVSRLGKRGGLALRPVDAQEIAREVIAAFPAPVSTDGDGNGVPDECD